MAKDMEIDNKRQAVQANLKAMIAKINSDGQAYNVSRQKYVTEKKNFEFAQKYAAENASIRKTLAAEVAKVNEAGIPRDIVFDFTW